MANEFDSLTKSNLEQSKRANKPKTKQTIIKTNQIKTKLTNKNKQ